jgi:PPM family protein phosphatase
MSFWNQLWKGFSSSKDLEPVPAESVPAAPPTAEQAASTEKLTNRGDQDEAAPAPLEFDISLQSDVGIVRTNNEDRGVYKRPNDPAIAAAKGTLVIVADGMGGASGGEVASEMAIRIIPDLYYNSSKPPAIALKEALEGASSEIHKSAQNDPCLHGMGTTCVAIALLQPQAFVAYVGDSRLYLLRDGDFYQLTEDHTVVVEMVRNGIITPDQARNHEERNVLSLSVGGRAEITASYWERPMIVRAGDRFLLCTDGLHDLVGEAEMRKIIADSPVESAVQELIETAKRYGGHDNITAALIHVRGAKVESDPVSKPTRELSISLE